MTEAQEKEPTKDTKKKAGIFKKIIKGYKYSLFGSWDEHQDRIERIKKYITNEKAKGKEISDALSLIEDEKIRFDSLIFMKGFSEVDIENSRRRFAIETILFSVFLITTIGFFFYNAINDFSVITCVGCLLASLLWGVKVMYSWWRFTQLSERRLMSFASWMRG